MPLPGQTYDPKSNPFFHGGSLRDRPWDRLYALCRVNDDDPNVLRVYAYNGSVAALLGGDGHFSSQPSLVSRAFYDAVRIESCPARDVAVAGVGTLSMAVFQLLARG